MNFSCMSKIYKRLKNRFDKLRAKKTLKTDYYKTIGFKKKQQVKKYMKLGFVDWTVDYYDLPNNVYSNYFPEINGQDNIAKLNRLYRIVLADKKLFCQLFSGMFSIPKIFFEYHNGNIRDTKTGALIDLDSFLDELSNSYILKPKDGEAGADIHLLSKEKNLFYLDWKIIEKTDLMRKITEIRGDIIFTEFITQHDSLRKIYPFSVNTTRILTYCDEGQVKVAGAVQRIGTMQTGIVDNATRGGVFADIDIKTGVMSYARRFSDNIKYSHHPDTKEQIEGCVIHRWKELLDLTLTEHQKIKFLDVIGWDLCVSKDDKIIVIEANSNPGIKIMQGREGLKNSEFGKFVAIKSKENY